MGKIVDGLNENMLDHFTLTNPKWRGSIDGRIKYNSEKELIIVEISEESVEYVETTIGYNIEFHVNRLPFQVQHRALDFVKNHNLVEILINNPEYDQSPKSEMLTSNACIPWSTR